MDITDEFKVSEVIKKYMMMPNYPKYFVHTAALTKPMDVNDRNPIMSVDTNIVGTANVARVCDKYGIKFIYISTDFVYKSYQNSSFYKTEVKEDDREMTIAEAAKELSQFGLIQTESTPTELGGAKAQGPAEL